MRGAVLIAKKTRNIMFPKILERLLELKNLNNWPMRIEKLILKMDRIFRIHWKNYPI